MKIKKNSFILFILLFVMMTFLGCGNTEDPAKTEKGPEKKNTATIDPCSLINKAQIEEIFSESFNGPFDESPDNNPLGQRICFWKAANEGSFRFLQVSIIKTSAIPSSNTASAETIYKGQKRIWISKRLRESVMMPSGEIWGFIF